MKHLIWFRADLRTIDNTALAAACQHPQAEVIGYILSVRNNGKNTIRLAVKLNLNWRLLNNLATVYSN